MDLTKREITVSYGGLPSGLAGCFAEAVRYVAAVVEADADADTASA